MQAMGRGSISFVMLLILVIVAGCATPSGQAWRALRQGRYDEAARLYEEVLAGEPDRLEALVGLGVSRYKLGAFAEAAEVLERVGARAPTNADARLYLGLSYLEKGEDDLADEHLTALRELGPGPRLAAQIDRALQLIRSEFLSDALRAFIAASLEDEAEWAREVQEARWAQRYHSRLPLRCVQTRHGVHCF